MHSAPLAIWATCGLSPAILAWLPSSDRKFLLGCTPNHALGPRTWRGIPVLAGPSWRCPSDLKTKQNTKTLFEFCFLLLFLTW